MDALGIPAVRMHGISGDGVRIAVIDSGVFAEHEDLTGVRIVPGMNYLGTDEASRADTTDTVGHGTFVSGLLAAALNGYGIAGLVPEAEIVPLRCFSEKTGRISDVITAIYGAVDIYHCQVLNLSLGITSSSRLLREAVEYADTQGAIMVSASGNLTSGTHRDSGDPLYYPAAYPEVVGVGAVGSALSIASFSMRNESVWVVAPGNGLRSLSCLGPDQYVTGGGTSYAAPMVAATAAMALSVEPSLSREDFMSLLQDTAQDLGEPGYDIIYGRYPAAHAHADEHAYANQYPNADKYACAHADKYPDTCSHEYAYPHAHPRADAHAAGAGIPAKRGRRDGDMERDTGGGGDRAGNRGDGQDGESALCGCISGGL